MPKMPRGGKGSDKRFAAYDAEVARIESLRCGASKYQIARLTAVTAHTAAVSVWQGNRCLGVVGLPEVDRWLTTEQRNARFNKPAL